MEIKQKPPTKSIYKKIQCIYDIKLGKQKVILLKYEIKNKRYIIRIIALTFLHIIIQTCNFRFGTKSNISR